MPVAAFQTQSIVKAIITYMVQLHHVSNALIKVTFLIIGHVNDNPLKIERGFGYYLDGIFTASAFVLHCTDINNLHKL